MKQLVLIMTLFLSIPSNIHAYALVFEYGKDERCSNEKTRLWASVTGPNLGTRSAKHEVLVGKKGRGSEWSWQEIERQSSGKIKKGNLMDLEIWEGLDDGLFKGKTLYKGKIASDSLLGFWIVDTTYCDANNCYCKQFPGGVKMMSATEAKQYYQSAK